MVPNKILSIANIVALLVALLGALGTSYFAYLSSQRFTACFAGLGIVFGLIGLAIDIAFKTNNRSVCHFGPGSYLNFSAFGILVCLFLYVTGCKEKKFFNPTVENPITSEDISDSTNNRPGQRVYHDGMPGLTDTEDEEAEARYLNDASISGAYKIPQGPIRSSKYQTSPPLSPWIQLEEMTPAPGVGDRTGRSRRGGQGTTDEGDHWQHGTRSGGGPGRRGLIGASSGQDRQGTSSMSRDWGTDPGPSRMPGTYKW